MKIAFVAVFCIVGGILAGMEIGWRQHAAEAEKPVYLTKVCPPPEKNTRWACDAAERRDYQNICLNRIAQTWRGK